VRTATLCNFDILDSLGALGLSPDGLEAIMHLVRQCPIVLDPCVELCDLQRYGCSCIGCLLLQEAQQQQRFLGQIPFSRQLSQNF
jgi:hypothetical protein